jgi:hypothetical protein
MGDMWTMPRLRERGWTPAMVRDLLGGPDELKPNPVYRSAAPMGLWAEARVTAGEADPVFAQRQAAASKRSAASARVAAHKREELLAKVASVPVRVPLMDRERLIREACASYNEFHAEYADFMATPGSDPEFLDRITVNYLRHELSSYEAELAALFGKTGRAEATAVIRRRVYRAIANAYPELATECGRQLSRRAAML